MMIQKEFQDLLDKIQKILLTNAYKNAKIDTVAGHLSNDMERWSSWFMAPVLKIGVRLQRTVGSNPTLSAKQQKLDIKDIKYLTFIYKMEMYPSGEGDCLLNSQVEKSARRFEPSHLRQVKKQLKIISYFFCIFKILLINISVVNYLEIRIINYSIIYTNIKVLVE